MNDPMSASVQEYIKSGEYFLYSRKWYKEKYLSPLTHRTALLICSVALFVLFISIILSVYSLFPTVQQVKYFLNVSNSEEKAATIIRAEGIDDNPLVSIALIMAQDYVKQREKYNYDLLKQQFTFIRNTSTRLTYKKFYNSMNIDNPNSAILRYKTDARRTVEILSSKYISDNEILIIFRSLAKNIIGGDVIENKKWEAILNFDIDNISLSAPANSKFNFTVTNYRLKELKDK